MSDFAPPTFSLGFEFDPDSAPQTTVVENPPPKSDPQPSNSAILHTILDFDDDDFKSPEIAPDSEESEQPRSLKRLRRGISNEPQTVVAQKPKSVDLWCSVEEEIEEFSSQEDKHTDEPLSKQPHSVCNSSKFPLPGHGFVTTQSTRQKKQESIAPSSSNLETASTKFTFPKLTVSPLRRFQLIDSDSDSDFDGPSISEGAKTAPTKTDSSLRGTKSYHCQNSNSTGLGKSKESLSVSQTDDLWSDFSLESFNIPTPALDEVCEEYFKSIQNKNKGPDTTKGCYQSNGFNKENEQQLNSGDPIPPAHRYFLSDDPRIQELVRSRLPHFFPLGAINNEGHKQPSSSVIDYMGQFSKGEGSKTSRKVNLESSSTRSRKSSSTRGRKSSRKSIVEEVPESSRSWVNPRSSVETPKDAGQRRVHAVGQSAGHWYMGPNGKRVYVTKDGQELSGRTAYRRYKKDSGGYATKKRGTGKKK